MATASTKEQKVEENCATNGTDSDERCQSCGCKCHKIPVTLRDHFWRDPFFSSNWEDFDRIRQKMIEDSKKMWEKFDDDFSRMGSTSCSSMTKSTEKSTTKSFSKEPFESDRSLLSSGFSRLPSIFNNNSYIDEDFPKFKDDQIIKVRNDDNTFEVSLDTHSFRPDELKVNIHNNTLTIEGKHEEKSEDGISRFVSREFVRKYSLPDGCQSDQVTSNLSSDGVLMITAPKISTPNDHGRIVPIRRK